MVKKSEIQIERKERKFPQHIWLSTGVFQKVLETAESLNVAPNVVCTQMVNNYLKNCEPIKTIEIEKVIVQKVFACHICLEEFSGIKPLVDHMKEKHKEV